MVLTPANRRPLSPEKLTAHRRKRTLPVISDGLRVLVRKNPSIPDQDRDDLFVGVRVEEPSASVSVRATRRSVHRSGVIPMPTAEDRGPIMIENATYTFGRTPLGRQSAVGVLSPGSRCARAQPWARSV
jgi:hypothetical protein